MQIPLDDVIFPPIVSLIALVLAVVLAVFQPWGRIGQPNAPNR